MAEPSQLLIEEIFFPVQEVRSLNDHSPQGERAGTQLKFGRQVQALDKQPGKYALALSVASDDEASRNPPYRFIIEANAIVTIGGTPLEGEAAAKFIMDNGIHILMGMVRERLADITARSPWGRFLISTLPLQEAQTINAM